MPNYSIFSTKKQFLYVFFELSVFIWGIPGPGNTFLIIDAEIKNIGTNTIDDASDYNFKLGDSDGNPYQNHDIIFKGDKEFGHVDLFLKISTNGGYYYSKFLLRQKI